MVRGVGRGRWDSFSIGIMHWSSFVVHLPPFLSFLFERSSYVRRSEKRERNEITR
jgi:hypothetical protein